MNRLFEAYRAAHQQAFLPIFCEQGVDSRQRVEACVAAGCRVIEFTLRQPDAREMIPWIRRTYPDLYLLVGSTLDDDNIVRQMRRRHPQLMTLAEIADFGVDGFVSMLGWSEASIRRWAPTHVVCPTAMTVREAVLQTTAGAHFQKLLGPQVDFVRQCRGAATFGFCPILVTGGQTPETIPATIEAGAMAVGSGFDLMLKNQGDKLDVNAIAAVVRQYLEAAQRAQAARWPALANLAAAPRADWLAALPHWHPFEDQASRSSTSRQ